MFSSNRRQSARIPIVVQVRIQCPVMGSIIVDTKNMSDTGLFIVVNATAMPAIGTRIKAQVLGMVDDPPQVTMEVVRLEQGGIGLKFCG